MLYHKIRGVPLEVCTAEQKIAYNIAFRAECFSSKYQEAESVSAVCAAEALDEIARIAFSWWMQDHAGKYNDDAIFAALRAGLAEYLKKPFIAWDYKQIGKAFPAEYMDSGKEAKTA